MVSVSSGVQPEMPNVLATMRVPGLSARNFGASLIEVVGQQEQREHGRLRDVGLEHVALDERRLVADALRLAVRFESSTSPG